MLSALLAAVAVAYAAALARLPQQRALVESLLQRETGLEVRFGAMAVRLGVYGPEAQFTDVEFSRRGEPLLRAATLLARFETWHLLRSGQLRPGRIIVRGAEIDLRALQQRAAFVEAFRSRADAPAARGPVLTQVEAHLARLLSGELRRLPMGSIEFESSTLLWGVAGGPPMRIDSPRIHYLRNADGIQLTAALLPPAQFGRSVFIAADLRPRSGLAPSSVALRLVARGGNLRTLAGLSPGEQPGLQGRGDVVGSLRMRGGLLLQAEAVVQLQSLRWGSAAAPAQRMLRAVSANLKAVRTGDTLQLRVTDISAKPAASILGRSGELRLTANLDTGGAELHATDLPIALTLAGAAWWSREQRSPFEWGAIGGQLTELHVSSPAAGKAGAAIDARFADLSWQPDGSSLLLSGLVGRIGGTTDRLTIDFEPVPAASLGSISDGADPLQFAAAGRLLAVHSGGQWVLRSDALQLRIDDLRVLLSATLIKAPPPAAARFMLRAQLRDAVAIESLTGLRDMLGTQRDALPFDLQGGRVSEARIEAAGTLAQSGVWHGEFTRGRVALRAASFGALGLGTRADAVDADFDWEGAALDGRIVAGKIGGLTILDGQLAARLEPLPRPVTARLQLAGDLAGAMTLLRSLGRDGAIADELPALDLRGPARYAWTWNAGSKAGSRPQVTLRADGMLPAEALAPLLGRAAVAALPPLLPWRASLRPQSGMRWRMQAALADLVRADLRWQLDADSRPTLERGAVRFGSGAAPRAPASRAIVVSGRLRAADIALLSRWAAEPPAGPAPLPPVRGRVEVENLQLGGLALGDHQLSFSATASATRVAANGASLSGEFSATRSGAAPAAARSLAVHVMRAQLPVREASELRWQDTLSDAFTADLQIDQLRVGDVDLGAWQGRVEFAPASLRAPELRFASGELHGTLQLDCATARDDCRVRALAASDDLRRSLPRIDLLSPVAAVLESDAPQSGPYSEIALDAIYATRQLHVSNLTLRGLREELSFAGSVDLGNGELRQLAVRRSSEPVAVAFPVAAAAWSAVRRWLPGEAAIRPPQAFSIQGTLRDPAVERIWDTSRP